MKNKNQTTEKGFELAASNFSMYTNKNEVQQSYHALIDALTKGPLGFALTEHPPIYIEVIEEMWISAKYSEEKDSIAVCIKGSSHTITPTVVNKALRLPTSNFNPVAPDKELKDMLEFIKYSEVCVSIGRINRKFLRKEWSFYFDALAKAFAAKQYGFDQINGFIMRIGHSLIYNRKINLGASLVTEICDKLGPRSERKTIIFYTRFLMIIANYLVSNLDELLVDVDAILYKHVQTRRIFIGLDRNNHNGEVDLVLPQHYQVYVSGPRRPQRQIVLRSDKMKEAQVPSLRTQVAQPSKSKLTKKLSTKISQKMVGQKRKSPTTFDNENRSENEDMALESQEEEKLSENMHLDDEVEVGEDEILLKNQEGVGEALHATESGASMGDEVASHTDILTSEFDADHEEFTGPSTSTETNRVLHPEIVDTSPDADVEIAHGLVYEDDTLATAKARLQTEQEAADQEDGNVDAWLDEEYITDLDEALRLVRTEYLTSMGSASTNLTPQALFEDLNKKYKSSLKLHNFVINGLQAEMSKLKGECENMRLQTRTHLDNTPTMGSINLRLAKESTLSTTVQELKNKVSSLETANAQILKNQQVMLDLLKAQSKSTTSPPAADDVKKRRKAKEQQVREIN